MRDTILVFGLSNALVCNGPLTEHPSETDFMVNLQWTNETNLFAFASMAENLGLDLPRSTFRHLNPALSFWLEGRACDSVQ